MKCDDLNDSFGKVSLNSDEVLLDEHNKSECANVQECKLNQCFVNEATRNTQSDINVMSNEATNVTQSDVDMMSNEESHGEDSPTSLLCNLSSETTKDNYTARLQTKEEHSQSCENESIIVLDNDLSLKDEEDSSIIVLYNDL